MREKKHLDKPAVFAAALLVAVGGLIYELILGTAASYLFGDSTVSFSIATGMTLFGMGLGSLLAGKLANRPGLNFAQNELLLSLLGGNSVLILFAAFGYSEFYWMVFVLLSLGIGIGIGIEIPLLVGLLKEFGKKSSIDLLSKVLAADYFGALIASLLFPFLLLPKLGLMRTAYAVALLNAAVALFILWRLDVSRRFSNKLGTFAVITVGILLACLIYASRIERKLDAGLYNDPIVHHEFSQYQKIVITQYRDDTRLFLNNQLQFSSKDEARYHETLAHSVMTSVSQPKTILILGGGDGLLAREILKYSGVESITLVDIDPAMTKLASNNRLLQDINDSSFKDKRVTIKNEDAFQFVRNSRQTYDVILIDLVDPSNERIAKLYSQQFYAFVTNRLNAHGAYVTQATSTYFTPNAFDQIKHTMQAASPDRQIVALSQNIPSFGEWGFLLSVKDTGQLFRATDLPKPLVFHNLESLKQTVLLPHHTSNKKSPAVSTLLNPDIYRTYQADMQEWSYTN